MPVPTLPDLKIHLNKMDSNDDAELQSMLDRAEAILARRVGPLTTTIVTNETHTGPGPILLRKYPVQSVTSATSYGSAVTDLDLDTDAGVLYGTFSSAPRSVKVTYTAGREDLPADLELAVLELVRHLWKSQRGGGSNRPSFPGEGEPEVEPTSGYLLPYRVQSLIEPYVLPVLA